MSCTNNKMNINFGLTGTVSVGKSTILNSLLCNYLGETKLKRTTYVPFKFTNTNEEQTMSCEEIKNKIIEINQNCGETIETTEFKLNFINKKALHTFSIIDFPGLNDPHEENDKMENILFDKLIKLDYLIYIIDANSSLNNKYERNLLEKLFEKIRDCDTMTNIIILFNKYDIEDEEIDEIIDEAIEFINSISEKYKISKPNYYKISGRKLMITNVITNTKDQSVIPENVRLKVYGEYFGKIKGRKMTKYSYDELYEVFKEIEFTDSECNFLMSIELAINDVDYYSKKLENTNELLSRKFNKNIDKTIEDYFISLAYYLKINKNLIDEDKRKLIIKIFDYYYDNNTTEFTNDKNFQENVFNFVSEIINKNDCFDDKNLWLFYYFTKTTEKFMNNKDISNNMIIGFIEYAEEQEDKIFIDYLWNLIIKLFLQTSRSFNLDNIGKQIFEFLIENYELIKEDDELGILFDAFIFEIILQKNTKILALISNQSRYGNKIYINYIQYIIDCMSDEKNEEIVFETNEYFNEMKFNYCYSDCNLSYKELNNLYTIQQIRVLNGMISYENDIFENFNKKLINYYPNDIITLYNFYKK